MWSGHFHCSPSSQHRSGGVVQARITCTQWCMAIHRLTTKVLILGSIILLQESHGCNAIGQWMKVPWLLKWRVVSYLILFVFWIDFGQDQLSIHWASDSHNDYHHLIDRSQVINNNSIRGQLMRWDSVNFLWRIATKSPTTPTDSYHYELDTDLFVAFRDIEIDLQ